MSTNFVVSWTEEVWYRVNIKANTAEEAKELFRAGEYDSTSSKETGGEIQDGIEVWPADTVQP